MTTKNAVKTTPAHHRALVALFDRVGATPFRRSDLSALLHPMTRPRDQQSADALADALLREAARAGTIERHGHLHWKKVELHRKLKSGRLAPEQADVAAIALNTRCPGKWAAVDLETGEVWFGTSDGWERAADSVVDEVRHCVARR